MSMVCRLMGKKIFKETDSAINAEKHLKATSQEISLIQQTIHNGLRVVHNWREGRKLLCAVAPTYLKKPESGMSVGQKNEDGTVWRYDKFSMVEKKLNTATRPPARPEHSVRRSSGHRTLVIRKRVGEEKMGEEKSETPTTKATLPHTTKNLADLSESDMTGLSKKKKKAALDFGEEDSNSSLKTSQDGRKEDGEGIKMKRPRQKKMRGNLLGTSQVATEPRAWPGFSIGQINVGMHDAKCAAPLPSTGKEKKNDGERPYTTPLVGAACGSSCAPHSEEHTSRAQHVAGPAPTGFRPSPFGVFVSKRNIFDDAAGETTSVRQCETARLKTGEVSESRQGSRCTWECAAKIHHLTKRVEELTRMVESLTKKSLVRDAGLAHGEHHSAAKSQAVVRVASKAPQAQPAKKTVKKTVPRGGQGRSSRPPTKARKEPRRRAKGRGKPLTPEQQLQIITGGSGYKPTRVVLLYFAGVAKNRPANIRRLLWNAGIPSRAVPHVGFVSNNALELLMYESVVDKAIAYLCGFKGVSWLNGYSPIESMEDVHIDALRKRLCSAIERENTALPLKRFAKILKRLAAVKRVEDAAMLHYQVASPPQQDIRPGVPDAPGSK